MSNSQKKTIKINKKRFIPFVITCLLSLTLLILAGREVYISNKCKDALYAIDYFLTNSKDKSLRLVKIETISVVEGDGNKLLIDAYGISYLKPYLKINVLGTFEKDNNKWKMTNAILKDANTDNKNNDNEITNIN